MPFIKTVFGPAFAAAYALSNSHGGETFHVYITNDSWRGKRMKIRESFYRAVVSVTKLALLIWVSGLTLLASFYSGVIMGDAWGVFFFLWFSVLGTVAFRTYMYNGKEPVVTPPQVLEGTIATIFQFTFVIAVTFGISILSEIVRGYSEPMGWGMFLVFNSLLFLRFGGIIKGKSALI